MPAAILPVIIGDVIVAHMEVIDPRKLFRIRCAQPGCSWQNEINLIRDHPDFSVKRDMDFGWHLKLKHPLANRELFAKCHGSPQIVNPKTDKPFLPTRKS